MWANECEVWGQRFMLHRVKQQRRAGLTAALGSSQMHNYLHFIVDLRENRFSWIIYFMCETDWKNIFIEENFSFHLLIVLRGGLNSPCTLSLTSLFWNADFSLCSIIIICVRQWDKEKFSGIKKFSWIKKIFLSCVKSSQEKIGRRFFLL